MCESDGMELWNEKLEPQTPSWSVLALALEPECSLEFFTRQVGRILRLKSCGCWGGVRGGILLAFSGSEQSLGKKSNLIMIILPFTL